MAAPDYQTLMLPLLRLLDNRKVLSLKELTAILADQSQLTEEDFIHLLAHQPRLKHLPFATTDTSGIPHCFPNRSQLVFNSGLFILVHFSGINLEYYPIFSSGDGTQFTV